VGVDAFALRRGCIDGTRLGDLARRQLIAVLEGRTAEPVIQWLQAHPAIVPTPMPSRAVWPLLTPSRWPIGFIWCAT
jgi:hypothetical protein